MLSIRFDDRREWWVSGQVFDRLYQSALDSGRMRAGMERWWHVTDANGGLDLSLLPPTEANELVAALRSTAERELATLSDVDPSSADGSYRTSLEQLLELTETWKPVDLFRH